MNTRRQMTSLDFWQICVPAGEQRKAIPGENMLSQETTLNNEYHAVFSEGKVGEITINSEWVYIRTEDVEGIYIISEWWRFVTHARLNHILAEYTERDVSVSRLLFKIGWHTDSHWKQGRITWVKFGLLLFPMGSLTIWRDKGRKFGLVNYHCHSEFDGFTYILKAQG